MKVNNWIAFFCGIVVGATIVLAATYYLGEKPPALNSNFGIELFEEPGQKLEGMEEYLVLQVLPDGYAIAMGDLFRSVLIPPLKNGKYYDFQNVKLPKGKCVRQIGVYRYVNDDDFIKTIPVIGFYPDVENQLVKKKR